MQHEGRQGGQGGGEGVDQGAGGHVLALDQQLALDVGPGRPPGGAGEGEDQGPVGERRLEAQARAGGLPEQGLGGEGLAHPGLTPQPQRLARPFRKHRPQVPLKLGDGSLAHAALQGSGGPIIRAAALQARYPRAGPRTQPTPPRESGRGGPERSCAPASSEKPPGDPGGSSARRRVYRVSHEYPTRPGRPCGVFVGNALYRLHKDTLQIRQRYIFVKPRALPSVGVDSLPSGDYPPKPGIRSPCRRPCRRRGQQGPSCLRASRRPRPRW